MAKESYKLEGETYPHWLGMFFRFVCGCIEGKLGKSAKQLGGTALLLFSLVMPVHGDTTQYLFDIPQQSADGALTLLAEQADISVVFDYAAVSGYQTHAVKGTYEVSAAVELLLSNSPLNHEFGSDHHLIVRLNDNLDENNNMQNNTKKTLLATFLGALATGTSTTPILAQENTSSTLDRTVTIEEVTVTARRREENLQEVPVAISAFSAEALENRGIENTEDLQVMLPNVDIRGNGQTGGAGGLFTVRGVRGVARYVDGVAQTTGQGSLSNVVELERIEVLRGPQGTYFGKNAIGGAIQYVTQKPSDEYGARVKATLGSYNRQDVTVNADIPLSDTLLSKITIASLQRDGYVESTVIDEAYGEIDNTIYRGMLEWTPSENFNVLFTAENSKEDTNMGAFVLFDVIEDFPRGPDTPGQYNDAGIPFTDELYAFGMNEEYKNAVDYQGPGIILDATAYSATATWDINDDISLKSISATRDVEAGAWQDTDGTHLVQFDAWQYSEIEETSQEFQLYGGNDRLDWIVGVYYQNSKQLDKAQTWQRYELDTTALRNNLSSTERTDLAFFAEGTFSLTDQLTLTLGARYSTEDYKGITYDPAEPIGDPLTPSFNMDGTIRQVDGVDLIKEASFSATTPRLALQYQWTDDVMVYVGAAQGFNGGGVNNTFTPSLDNNGIIPYDEELLTNYEIGVRSDLFDNRLRFNATAFFGIWEDIQIGETLVPGQQTTTNAGEAEISGLEVEGQLQLTDSVSLDFTYGLLNTEYTEIGMATTIELGTPFPFSPEHSYSLGAQWDHDLNSGSSIAARVDYGHISDFETFVDADFQASQGVNKGYGLLGARLTYYSRNEDWNVSLFGSNLTNQWYRLGGFSAVLAGVDKGVVARPREVGVSLSMNF